MNNLVRKPDEGNPHVRFDERDVETGARLTAPYLDSTDGLLRNRAVSLRDGHAEPEAPSMLEQYVEWASEGPVHRRLVAAANPRLQRKRS